jgi:hypothetical protein
VLAAATKTQTETQYHVMAQKLAQMHQIPPELQQEPELFFVGLVQTMVDAMVIRMLPLVALLAKVVALKLDIEYVA